MALADNLHDYWTLDSTRNGSKSVLSITSGGASYETGKINNGVRYNGSFDTLAYTSAISAGTIAFWFKPIGVGSGETHRLFAKTQVGVSDVVGIFASNYGKRFRLDMGDSNIFTDTTDRFSYGTWYHLAVTWNGTTIKGYVNGVEVYSVSSTKTVAANSQSFTIGGWSGNSVQNTNAVIDEIGLWLSAKTGSEISELYNSGNGNQYPFNVNVTVSATVQTATFSAPTRTVTGTANVSANTVSATLSTQAPNISAGAGVSVGVVSATFSIPSPNIITPDALVNASVVSALFSAQAPSVTGQAIVSSSVLTATFSQPSTSFVGSVSVTPSAQNATFSIQAPTIQAVGNVTVSASAVSGTFSIQNPTITAETFAEAGVVSATFSTLSVTVTTTQSVTVDASVMTATFSVVKPLRKVGGLWTAQPRNEGVWVPQGRVA